MDDRLSLKAAKWYGWQMLPGYGSSYEPYSSPILVEKVTAEKSGKGWLQLHFYNAFYAQGVQGFVLRLRVVDRTEKYLIARPDYPESTMRHAIINRISFEWVEARFPIDYYLNQRFFRTLRPIGPVPS